MHLQMVIIYIKGHKLMVGAQYLALNNSLIEYIIFHEVVHVFKRKHNRKFWEIISRKYKDYPKFEKEMFAYWFKISEILDQAYVYDII